MKLSLIIETIQDMVNMISKRDHLDHDYINYIINTTAPTKKYSQFVLRQWAKQDVRLPEDSNRLRDALLLFDNVKSRLSNKDLLSYKRLSDLEDALELVADAVSKRQGGSDINDPTKLPGVELYNSKNQYKSYKITSVESLQQLGEGTKWCTRGSYKDCMASHYINEHGWIGQIWDGNKPIIQYTPDYLQIMDRKDNEIEATDRKKLAELFIKPTDVQSSSMINYVWYAEYIIQERWPEGEEVIKKDPHRSIIYALGVIHDRWPEAEPYILQDVETIISYVNHVIRGRWPEGEEVIKKYPTEAYIYANDIIRGRFPEAEPYIIKEKASYIAAMYAAYMMKKRWPAAEKLILDMKNAKAAVVYAIKVIKGKWPEAEEFIYADPKYGNNYHNFVNYKNISHEYLYSDI